MINHMVNNYLIGLRKWKRVAILFFCLVIMHFALQAAFLWQNQDLFEVTSIQENCMSITGYALQIDVASILLLNLPVIAFFILYSYIKIGEKQMKKIILVIAIVLNLLGVFLNIFDVGYFRYSKERATAALTTVVFDSVTFIPAMLKEYVLLFLCGLLVSGLTVWLIKRFLREDVSEETPSKIYLVPLHIGLIIFLFFAIRGTRSLPLIPTTPLLSVHPLDLPLAQNSVHTFLYSMIRRQHQLVRKNYFSKEESERIVSSNRGAGASTQIQIKKNVVLFILESFSADYFEEENKHRAFTPFFDSLIGKSLYFPNAHANAFSSNHGIVAILGGLPNFLDEPFYYSAYANTRMITAGNIFNSNGYITNFFMGAGDDHFGFRKFCKMIGIDNYYSRKDFNDDRYFDGNWGIFDGPFLQYGVKELNRQEKPFFSVFFTISSHPPFTIPAEFDFPGNSPSTKSIAYVDHAFRAFFDSARNTNWFNNTLFVFCADHWLAQDDASWSLTKSSAIPIFIHDPSNSSGKVDSSIAAQVDLIPTLFDMIKYKGDVTSFGKSLLDSADANKYVVNKFSGVFQIITDEWILGYDEKAEQTKYLYNYKTDVSMKKNVVDDNSFAQRKKVLENLLKANLQKFNNSLLDRNLVN